MEEIIKVENLKKNYGSVKAVDDISFTVKEGNLFAFLGPNGAGKSTVVNILCTLLTKDEGQVFIDNLNLNDKESLIRNKIGVVFQDNVSDDLLTVKENLLMRGYFYNLEEKKILRQFDNVVDYLGIGDIVNRRFGKLSGGQKRRVEIAGALMNDPKILFLDEPTTGLDPQTRIKVWEIIKKLQDEFNMTVFLTTHYMEEAASADMVAVIDHGKIVVEGTPNQLKKKYSYDQLKIQFKKIKDGMQLLQDKGYEPKKVADMVNIPVKDSMEAFNLLKEIEEQFTDFEVIKGNMDDVFVNITGRKIREDE